MAGPGLSGQTGEHGRVLAVARRVVRGRAVALVEPVPRDVPATGRAGHQALHVGLGERAVVDLELIDGALEQRVPVLRPADPVVSGSAEAARVQRHGGVGRHRSAVEIEGSGAAGQRHGEVRPGARVDPLCRADPLLGPAPAGADGETRAGAGVERQEHVVRGAGAEIEDPRPAADGRRPHPGGDGEVLEPGHDAGGQRHVVGGAVQFESVAEGPGGPGDGRWGAGLSHLGVQRVLAFAERIDEIVDPVEERPVAGARVPERVRAEEMPGEVAAQVAALDLPTAGLGRAEGRQAGVEPEEVEHVVDRVVQQELADPVPVGGEQAVVQRHLLVVERLHHPARRHRDFAACADRRRARRHRRGDRSERGQPQHISS